MSTSDEQHNFIEDIRHGSGDNIEDISQDDVK